MTNGLDETCGLSQRAEEQIPPNGLNVMWDVMKDPWDPQRNPSGYVNVGVAENRLMQAELEDYLSQYIDICGSVLTYEDGPTGSYQLRKGMARFLNRHMSPHKQLKASHIIVTNGVSNAIEHTSWAIANPGNAFLLGKPYYGAINLALRPQVRTVLVTFGQVDPLSMTAVQCYEDAILDARRQGMTIKGLMLCNPHNPLGRCYPRDVLIAYLKLCNNYQIHLVSDEIYALSVWRNSRDAHLLAPFTSILSIRIESFIDPKFVHVLWGISKDFGANGWRLGCIISQYNRYFHAALNSVAIYSYVSSITDHIVTQMLEDDEFTDSYIRTNRTRLSGAYGFSTDFLRQNEIPYAPGSNAAFFLWVDLGRAYRARHPDTASKGNITEVVKNALLKQKVYLACGEDFGSEQPGIFRIAFAHPREYMKEALCRIVKALELGNFDQSPMAKL